MSPFEVVLGRQTYNAARCRYQKKQGKCPVAYRAARDKHEMLAEVQDILRMAQSWMKKYADLHKRKLELGNNALLKLSSNPKQIVSKLRHRGLIPMYDGPFEVV